jgi:glycerate 2-kinase
LNILICPDKFKGSLTATEVCDAVTDGLRRINAKFAIHAVPLADGGEGTCALLTEWNQGKKIDIQVTGPLFSPVNAHYGISGDGHTAFIEMALASGLTLVPPELRNPLLTTSVGTGEIIADALSRGVKKIVLGIGGSATNDAGIGMATALGYRFCDVDGEILKPTGENLIHIHHIETPDVPLQLKNARVIALCDVTNPLYGPDGAAYVYGPQKGAGKAAVELLDAGLRNFRRVVHKYLKTSVDFPGAGAAGGLGAGCKAFLHATMEKGVRYIIRNSSLDEKIAWADLIITGEGRIDRQTFSGKVVSEVLRLAQDKNRPVIAVCGKCDIQEPEIREYGIGKLISLVDETTTPESAIKHASTHLSEKIFRECKNLPSL